MNDFDRKLNASVDARTNLSPAPLPLASADPDGLKALRAAWRQMPMIPRIVLDRIDGRDDSWPGFDMRTILIGEESAGRFAFHDLVLNPGFGLPKHRLEGADVYWYVLDGEIEVTVGGRQQRVGRDAFAYAPDGTTQAWRNLGEEPARLFLWTSPAGSERAFAAAHALFRVSPDLSPDAYLRALEPFGYRFSDIEAEQPGDATPKAPVARIEARIDTFRDFVALRERWAEWPATPKLVQDRTSCHDIPMAGQDTKVLLSGDEAAGRAVVFNYGVEPGYSAPPHHQPSEEEIFLVVEGDLQLTAGNVTTLLPRGGFGFVPRYGTHAFQNPTQKLTRTVTINSPAGHERGFEMVVREAGSPRFPELLVAHGWNLHEEYAPS